jgi:hypothetical protein
LQSKLSRKNPKRCTRNALAKRWGVRFIAQLCFADSRDIVGELPGDVLLIFGDDDSPLVEPQRLAFEWSSLGIQECALEVPQMGASELLAPYYGVIHRTEDWPNAADEIGGRFRCPWLHLS